MIAFRKQSLRLVYEHLLSTKRYCHLDLWLCRILDPASFFVPLVSWTTSAAHSSVCGGSRDGPIKRPRALRGQNREDVLSVFLPCALGPALHAHHHVCRIHLLPLPCLLAGFAWGHEIFGALRPTCVSTFGRRQRGCPSLCPEMLSLSLSFYLSLSLSLSYMQASLRAMYAHVHAFSVQGVACPRSACRIRPCGVSSRPVAACTAH